MKVYIAIALEHDNIDERSNCHRLQDRLREYLDNDLRRIVGSHAAYETYTSVYPAGFYEMKAKSLIGETPSPHHVLCSSLPNTSIGSKGCSCSAIAKALAPFTK